MTKATIIFASAFRADKTEVENAHNSIIASQKIASMLVAPAQTAVGSWKEEGQDKASVELTFVMPVKEESIQDVINTFCIDFNQDAVLCVNPSDMSAHIVERDGNTFEIGTFQVIDEEEAKASECYTYWNGKYWLAK